MDIYLVAESLLMDLLLAKVGQDCPVILIGHSFGGLVIKQLCLTAHKIICRQLHRPDNETLARKIFLQSVKAIFYIATPHTGAHFADVVEKRILREGELLQLVKVFSKELARLNDDFNHIRRDSYSHWHIAGLGETLPTQLGREFTGLVVEEASARCENFVAVQEDHISICQPKSRESTSYQYLCRVIRQVQQQLADEPYSYPLTTLPGFETYVPIHTEARERVIGALNDDSGPSIILLHGDPVWAKRRSKSIAREMHEELHPRIHQSRHLCDNPEKCRLPNLLCGKDIITVIDDVWEAKVIEAFSDVMRRARAAHVKLLVTSRRSDLYEDPDVMKVKTEEISLEDAKKMLASHLGLKQIPDFLQGSARQLIEKTGRHPLALAMVAGRITREKKEDPKQWKQVAESYSTMLRNEVIDAFESRTARTHYVPVLASLYERSIGETLLLTYRDLEEDARYLLLLLAKCTGPSTPTHVVQLLYTYARLNLQCDREPEPFQIQRSVLENSGTMLRVERGKVPGLWNFPLYEYETLALHDLEKEFLNCLNEEENKQLEVCLLEKQTPAATEGRVTCAEQDTTFIWELCVLYLRQDLAEKAAEKLGGNSLFNKEFLFQYSKMHLNPSCVSWRKIQIII
ncbi:hypothetical protein R1sor_022890 [Riccia sorocarpa]|uniref:NB-ARC domain-containing protein n=1 Tax=Riccia sorocarpa TaxID=122646 RepID=A0ABD3GNC0_9MARC